MTKNNTFIYGTKWNFMIKSLKTHPLSERYWDGWINTQVSIILILMLQQKMTDCHIKILILKSIFLQCISFVITFFFCSLTVSQ